MFCKYSIILINNLCEMPASVSNSVEELRFDSLTVCGTEFGVVLNAWNLTLLQKLHRELGRLALVCKSQICVIILAKTTAHAMGSSISHDDKKRERKLKEELKKMEYRMGVTAAAQYVSSEFYSDRGIKLQYTSHITGMLGAPGGVFSKLSCKTISQNYPRLGPVAAATAAMMSLFAVLVNKRSLSDSPAVLHHGYTSLRSGIECQCLKRRVRFETWTYHVMFGTWTYNGPRLYQDIKI